MKLFDVSQSVLDTVKNVMVESPACIGKAKGCTCKKCKPVKEESEVIDEGNKENKFKKDLYIAKKGVEYQSKNLGISPEMHADMSRAFGHDHATSKDNMKALLKLYKKTGRALSKEEVEAANEGFEIGKVYHIGKEGDRGYFIPKEIQKNGKHKGLQFDGGAAGRSSKKPTTASYEYHQSWKNTPSEEIPDHIKSHLKEEVEQVDEVRDPGSTVGSTPLKTKGKYVSDDGRHVAKIRRDKDWNEYRVEIHSDGVHNKNADYHTDDKEDAHDTAKAMLAHAVKHAKPLGEAVMVAGGGDENKRKEINLAKTKKAFPNVTHFTKDGHPDWKKHGNPQNEETETVIEDTLISKIINKYNNK